MSQTQFVVTVTNQKGFPKFQLFEKYAGDPVDTSNMSEWGTPGGTFGTSPSSASYDLTEPDGVTPFNIKVSE